MPHRSTTTVLSREACERRVYRLATLLTGNPTAATRVIESVVDAQPDLRRLDNAHLDRLSVLRSREITPARLVDESVPAGVAQAVADFDPQSREAWVFARVYRMPLREIARAMDCSATAAERHLDRADASIGRTPDVEAEEAAACLRAYTLALDVPAFHRARQHRRRRRRLVVQFVAIAIAVVVLVAVVIVVWRWIGSGATA